MKKAEAFSKPEQEVLRRAVYIRAVEELILELYAQGELAGTTHTCLGQELVPAVLAGFLREGDRMFSSHRNHGHFLAAGGTPRALLAELFGRSEGCSGGRGGSQHLHLPNFLSMGIQGSLLPVAAGVAWGIKRRKEGSVAFAMIGDGTLGQGILYETLNFISLHRLPLVIVLEDNGWAQSTRTERTTAGDIRARAAAFGIEFQEGDTASWRALPEQMGGAIAAARSGEGPRFLAIKTARLGPHSKGDDLRDDAELGALRDADPLNRALKSDSSVQSMLQQAREELLKTLAEVKKAAPLGLQSLAEVPGGIDGSWGGVPSWPARWKPGRSGVTPGARVVDRLNQGLNELLAEDKHAVLLGEDIEDPYGGAFKVTRGLSTAFPDRVLNMPISEALVVGVGTGLALKGLKPVVEIMFGDFLTLCVDQLVNVAAKLPYLSTSHATGGVVVRAPSGGYRGYGPTHSQSLEKMFFGISGLRIAALNRAVDPARVLKACLSGYAGPTLLVENKKLYFEPLLTRELEGFTVEFSEDAFPTVLISPTSQPARFAIVAYGQMTSLAIEAVQLLKTEYGIPASVLSPTCIQPFQIGRYADVLASCEGVVIVDESTASGGFSAEVSAQVGELASGRLRCLRVTGLSTNVPAEPGVERSVLPTPARIAARIAKGFA